MLTKSDLTNIGKLINQKLDQKLDQKLKPIKKNLQVMNKKLDLTIAQFDRQNNYHHRRLVQLEEKVGVKPPPFLSPAI